LSREKYSDEPAKSPGKLSASVASDRSHQSPLRRRKTGIASLWEITIKNDYREDYQRNDEKPLKCQI